MMSRGRVNNNSSLFIFQATKTSEFRHLFCNKATLKTQRSHLNKHYHWMALYSTFALMYSHMQPHKVKLNVLATALHKIIYFVA